MKIVWHIIKHDILRDRCALLVWALLFAGQIGMGLVMLHWSSVDLRDVMHVQMASAVLVFLQFAMGYILVARLVHADALVGTTMFWRTRPVSPASLLLGKALGALLLFGVLPVLLLVPWWLYCHFGWRDIGWAALETFGWQLLMIAPAFLVASLTDDLGRVLLWTLLLLIGLMSWIVLLQASFTAALGREFSYGGVDRMYTRLVVVGLLFTVGSAAIAAHQYLTRRFVRSVVLAAAGLGVIVLAGHLFPWNWAPAIRRLTERTLGAAPAAMTERIAFEVLSAQDVATPNAGDRRGPAAADTVLYLRLRAHGLPEGLQLGVENASHVWTWPNGVSITRRTSYYGGFDFDYPSLRQQFVLPAPVADPETEQWMKTKRTEFDARRGYRRRETDEERAGRMLTAFAPLPNSFVGKMRKDPAAYAVSFQGVLYRMDVMAVLPLVKGAQAAGGTHTFRLQRVQPGQPCQVLITEPLFLNSGLWNSGAVSRWEEGNWRTRAQPIAVNSVTGDIGWTAGNQSGSQYLMVAGVMMNWDLMHLMASRPVIRNGKNMGMAAIDPQWQDHTKLVFLTPNPIGSFNREVKAENYTVTDDYWDDVRTGSNAGAKP